MDIKTLKFPSRNCFLGLLAHVLALKHLSEQKSASPWCAAFPLVKFLLLSLSCMVNAWLTHQDEFSCYSGLGSTTVAESSRHHSSLPCPQWWRSVKWSSSSSVVLKTCLLFCHLTKGWHISAKVLLNRDFLLVSLCQKKGVRNLIKMKLCQSFHHFNAEGFF